jgi:transcriptional regulator with XRE-family HTH domain
MSETLADFIRRAVALRSTSLRQASIDMGFGASYLERVVNGGIRQPSPDRIKVMARYFSADPDYLMQLAGYLSPPISDDPVFDEIVRLVSTLSNESKLTCLNVLRALKTQDDVVNQIRIVGEEGVAAEKDPLPTDIKAHVS